MTDYILPKSSQNWNNEDYYNHYLQTKRFGFGFIKDFKKNQYDEVKQRILELKELYFFIYNKLPEDSKNEFKFDFLDNLKITKEKQTLTKFKVIISNIIAEIEKQPQQAETKKPDEVKKELHPEIFKDNYFEVWQKMYDAFGIKESSYNKNLDFMYNVMFDKGFINKNIGKKDMVNWINDIYQITFTKIRYTNHKDSSNGTRLIIFNEILENSKGTKHT